jgi:hypothetical protein
VQTTFDLCLLPSVLGVDGSLLYENLAHEDYRLHMTHIHTHFSPRIRSRCRVIFIFDTRLNGLVLGSDLRKPWVPLLAKLAVVVYSNLRRGNSSSSNSIQIRLWTLEHSPHVFYALLYLCQYALQRHIISDGIVVQVHPALDRPYPSAREIVKMVRREWHLERRTCRWPSL